MENMNTSQLDVNKLKEVTNATNTSVAVMLNLASRERDVRNSTTNLHAFKGILLRAGEKIIDEEYLKFWQGLEAAGIGAYIVGRRGNPDRFKWHYSTKEIANLAVHDKATLPVKIIEVKGKVGRPKGYSPLKKRGKVGRPKGFSPKKSKRRPRMSSENKAIERRVMEVLRQALLK